MPFSPQQFATVNTSIIKSNWKFKTKQKYWITKFNHHSCCYHELLYLFREREKNAYFDTHDKCVPVHFNKWLIKILLNLSKIWISFDLYRSLVQIFWPTVSRQIWNMQLDFVKTRKSQSCSKTAGLLIEYKIGCSATLFLQGTESIFLVFFNIKKLKFNWEKMIGKSQY